MTNEIRNCNNITKMNQWITNLQMVEKKLGPRGNHLGFARPEKFSLVGALGSGLGVQNDFVVGVPLRFPTGSFREMRLVGRSGPPLQRSEFQNSTKTSYTNFDVPKREI